MNKKNKILFFLFSLIPGAAHMYIGLVKRGLVIMLALVAGAGLAMMADTPAFLLVLPVLWFYSFFDAWNKYHLPEDKLAKVQDDFLFFLNAMPENVRSDPRFKKVASANVLKVGGIVDNSRSLSYLGSDNSQSSEPPAQRYGRRDPEPNFL